MLEEYNTRVVWKLGILSLHVQMYVKLHVCIPCKTRTNPPCYSKLTSVPNKLGNNAKTGHLGGTLVKGLLRQGALCIKNYYHGYTQWIEESFFPIQSEYHTEKSEVWQMSKKRRLKNYYWLTWGLECNAIRPYGLNRLEFCQNLFTSRYSFPTANNCNISHTPAKI